MTKLQTAIDRIAIETLDIKTLDERGFDSLDFYDLSVSSIKAALAAAYEAGKAEAQDGRDQIERMKRQGYFGAGITCDSKGFNPAAQTG